MGQLGFGSNRLEHGDWSQSTNSTILPESIKGPAEQKSHTCPIYVAI